MKKLKAVQLVIGKAARIVRPARRPAPTPIARPLDHPANLVDDAGLPVPPPEVESDGPQPLDVRPRRVRGRADGELPPPFKPAPRRPDGTRP